MSNLPTLTPLARILEGAGHIVSNATRWSTLREIGNLSAVRMTILIPVIGYVILFNENVLQYLKLTPELDGQRVGVISGRLLLIYFGLCILALGSALYWWKCPRVVKQHPSGAAFVTSEKHVLSPSQWFHLDRMIQVVNPHSHIEMTYLVSWEASEAPETQFWNDNDKIEVMQRYYETMDTSRAHSRFWVASFFAMGFAYLAVPAIDVFVRCLRLALSVIP